jgi:hypothetical protein
VIVKCLFEVVDVEISFISHEAQRVCLFHVYIHSAVSSGALVLTNSSSSFCVFFGLGGAGRWTPEHLQWEFTPLGTALDPSCPNPPGLSGNGNTAQ